MPEHQTVPHGSRSGGTPQAFESEFGPCLTTDALGFHLQVRVQVRNHNDQPKPCRGAPEPTCSHLSIHRDTQSIHPIILLRGAVVRDHHPVRDHDSWCIPGTREESRGMSGAHGERLRLTHDAQVVHEEMVLSPVAQHTPLTWLWWVGWLVEITRHV